MYVCVKPKHHGEYYQPRTSVPFTEPALLMAHWNNVKLFISCAALKIFPSCASAVYNKVLIPLLAESDLTKKEVLGLPGGNKFLFYNKK